MFKIEIKIVKENLVKYLVKGKKVKGYTKEKFAELLDLSKEHIAKIEKGKRKKKYYF